MTNDAKCKTCGDSRWIYDGIHTEHEAPTIYCPDCTHPTEDAKRIAEIELEAEWCKDTRSELLRQRLLLLAIAKRQQAELEQLRPVVRLARWLRDAMLADRKWREYTKASWYKELSAHLDTLDNTNTEGEE